MTSRSAPPPSASEAPAAALLLPCPFCGGVAAYGEVEDEESIDFGGHFIQCTNARCAASTNLRFASKDDPRPLLAEQWNLRSGKMPSSLCDDEDERGFTPSDYAHTAGLLCSTEEIRKAASSNNINIILAALYRCAAEADLLGVLREIAEHPGPNADEAAHWRADLARDAIAKAEGASEALREPSAASHK